MIHAVGYCSVPFNPARPGRLCRGRERWVAGWSEEVEDTIWRLVISGASFSDDSARDAKRGLTWSGVDIGIARVFPILELFPRGFRVDRLDFQRALAHRRSQGNNVTLAQAG